jgi:hypothetical protein
MKKTGRLNKIWLAILTSLFDGLMLRADYLTRYDPLVLKLAAGSARVLRPEIRATVSVGGVEQPAARCFAMNTFFDGTPTGSQSGGISARRSCTRPRVLSDDLVDEPLNGVVLRSDHRLQLHFVHGRDVGITVGDSTPQPVAGLELLGAPESGGVDQEVLHLARARRLARRGKGHRRQSFQGEPLEGEERMAFRFHARSSPPVERNSQATSIFVG